MPPRETLSAALSRLDQGVVETHHGKDLATGVRRAIVAGLPTAKETGPSGNRGGWKRVRWGSIPPGSIPQHRAGCIDPSIVHFRRWLWGQEHDSRKSVGRSKEAKSCNDGGIDGDNTQDQSRSNNDGCGVVRRL